MKHSVLSKDQMQIDYFVFSQELVAGSFCFSLEAYKVFFVNSRKKIWCGNLQFNSSYINHRFNIIALLENKTSSGIEIVLIIVLSYTPVLTPKFTK